MAALSLAVAFGARLAFAATAPLPETIVVPVPSPDPGQARPASEAPPASLEDEMLDAGAASAPGDEPDATAALPFRGSLLLWENSATTQTFGLGGDYQSRNPLYEMLFGLRPRLYLLDRDRQSLSLRAVVGLVREFTDSDTTTRRGEWTFTDAELWLAYARTLSARPDARTEVVVRLPHLVLPTSKVSWASGKILGLGLGGALTQGVPLGRQNERVLRSLKVGFSAGYVYQFVDTVVPTNEGVERVRLGPDGRSLPSDQLRGTAFSQHQASALLTAETELLPRLTFMTELGMRWALRYALDERVEICGVVLTGCAEVEQRDDATRFGVSTLFTAELGYELRDEVTLSLGYTNLAPQLGADGKRRSLFYSPEARGYLTVTIALDELALTASGRRVPTSRSVSSLPPGVSGAPSAW